MFIWTYTPIYTLVYWEKINYKYNFIVQTDFITNFRSNIQEKWIMLMASIRAIQRAITKCASRIYSEYKEKKKGFFPLQNMI